MSRSGNQTSSAHSAVSARRGGRGGVGFERLKDAAGRRKARAIRFDFAQRVRWYPGCVESRSGYDRQQREFFVAFLERFVNGDVDPDRWDTLVVNHYLDEALERVRRECVRLRVGNEAMHWSEEERTSILACIRELRTGLE